MFCCIEFDLSDHFGNGIFWSDGEKKMNMVLIVIRLDDLYFRKMLMKFLEAFHHVFECAVVEYFFTIFTDQNYMVLVVIYAVALSSEFHEQEYITPKTRQGICSIHGSVDPWF